MLTTVTEIRGITAAVRDCYKLELSTSGFLQSAALQLLDIRNEQTNTFTIFR
ncbi:hypothetical protein NSTC731_05419 [Nostoc sp. DSM 114167]|jgi:hypothetical protein